MRLATPADFPLIQAWRADPLSMAMSRRQRPLSLEEIADEPAHGHRVMWEVGDIPVGVITFDHGSGRCELSWMVAPEHRRQGHGKFMVRWAVNDSLDCHVDGPFAMIKPDNFMSQAIAKFAGMFMTGIEDGLQRWEAK